MINILIVDDHNMFADGIEMLLTSDDTIKVNGKCAEGGYVVPFLRQHEIDVILLDINLPDINGIEVCKRVLKEFPNMKIIALSMFNEHSYVTEMINQGAKGYILKNTGKEELLKAIRYVNNGQNFFSKEVTETITRGLMTSNEKKEKEKNTPKLSRREQEILQLIVNEHTTQEIAEQLFLSQKTIESHRSTLLTKLNVRNIAGLVRYAIEHQLVAH